MMLFNRIGLERNILIEDATGKKLPAKTVFMISIKYLKDDLIKELRKRLTGDAIRNNDIHWVLTVPAIWNDSAKQFMREAAEQAGILGDHLTICLEPEAASLYCRHLPLEKNLEQTNVLLATLKAGSRHLVLDAGGGKVDTTVHELQRNGEIRELHKATGGDWGGTKVDLAFENFLGEIVGKAVIIEFKEKYMVDYLELFRDFEIKKRDTSLNKVSKITISIPQSLFDLVTEMTGIPMKECILKSKYREKLAVLSNKIRMERDVMQSLFNDTITKILSHVEMLLRQPSVSGCTTIVMVGGFSESALLQERIQQTFEGLTVVIPVEAGLAVPKGAVIYGHNPTTIAVRICKLTYGRSTTHITTDKCRHPVGRREIDKNGEMRCYDLFQIHAKAGQSVTLGEEGEELTCSPIYDEQSKIDFRIYASSSESPFLVTQPGCTKIEGFEVPIKDKSFGRDRKFGIRFILGGTEIQVEVTDKITGKSVIKSVDFLG